MMYLPRKLHSWKSGSQGGPASNQIGINFKNDGFRVEGKTEEPREKSLGAE